MRVYLDLVMVLNFFVDLCLLAGANSLAGFPAAWGRMSLAALMGAVYAGGCLMPGFSFLGNTVWRVVSLVLMGAVAYGWRWDALRRGALFLLLSLALGGAAVGLNGGLPALTVAAAGIGVLCVVGFRDIPGQAEYVPVMLRHGNTQVQLLALRDTGNTLRDPVTGQSVLVADARVAERLTGLSPQQLARPVETMASAKVPGLRLIPYRSVGRSGMLLAIRVQEAKIGSQRGSTLVAFAPEGLDREGTYQALTGGAV